MQCLNCGAQMDTRRENYLYTASGLPHVTLEQIEVSRCPVCGEVEVAIPCIETLHRVIASTLIRKRARLAPEEIRYLRKYLGWSGVDFAARMGVDPAVVSRWENGKDVMGKLADRLLRLLVVTQVPVQDYSADLLTEIAEDVDVRAMRLGLRTDEHDWHADAFALA
jgi:putative zinc finger/helix-turn-helix YgiT family protein